jgi:hypothetical protein
MADTPEDQEDDEVEQPLTERFLDLFVYLPTGLAVTVVEELPRLAERGRERLGVQVNSARAVGKFAVRAGHRELRRRSEGFKRDKSEPLATSGSPAAPTTSGPPRLRAIPRPPATSPSSAQTPAQSPTQAPAPPQPTATTPDPAPTRPANGHVPEVSSLAIPGFDTLSASQVVQRLDGLSRSELVAVRTYETSTRGRRTILSRVDQLLDERS